jgi:hypothetical protein
MSALVVTGTFCIRFVYMGGFLFNEIITYKNIYIYHGSQVSFFVFVSFFFFNRCLVN